MGYSPAQAREMTLWEFAVCGNGWKKSQGIEDADDLPDRETMLATLRD